jgi:hypothetical protein
MYLVSALVSVAAIHILTTLLIGVRLLIKHRHTGRRDALDVILAFVIAALWPALVMDRITAKLR